VLHENQVGVVVRDIDHFGIGGFDPNDLPLPNHDLFFIGVEVAGRFRFLADRLDGVHDILLLKVDRIS